MTNLDSTLKTRDITLPTKVHLVRAMVFPVVMYGFESWTISKLRTKELMLLNCGVGEDSWVPWTSRRYNQSILKEISPEYLLEKLMLKLKVQYFGHLMRRTDSFEKIPCWERLKAGGDGDDRGWYGWMASPAVGDGQWSLVCCSPQGHKESDTTEQLKWSELNYTTRAKGLMCWEDFWRKEQREVVWKTRAGELECLAWK